MIKIIITIVVIIASTLFAYNIGYDRGYSDYLDEQIETTGKAAACESQGGYYEIISTKPLRGECRY